MCSVLVEIEGMERWSVFALAAKDVRSVNYTGFAHTPI